MCLAELKAQQWQHQERSIHPQEEINHLAIVVTKDSSFTHSHIGLFPQTLSTSSVYKPGPMLGAQDTSLNKTVLTSMEKSNKQKEKPAI